jgi:hypothetical protein
MARTTLSPCLPRPPRAGVWWECPSSRKFLMTPRRLTSFYCVFKKMKRVYREKQFKIRDPLSLGKEYEATLNSKEFRRYQDTIHRVIPLEHDEKSNLYKCKLTAFDVDDIDWYDREQIREIDDEVVGPSKKWKAKETVKIQMDNRKIGGEVLDGRAEKIWVKAEIKEFLGHNIYLVQHQDWERKEGVKTVAIHESQIKSF